MNLRATTTAKHLTVIRGLAAIPLIGIGAQHLLGTAPMLPILESASIPGASLFAWLVPVLEVLTGLGLVVGFHARIQALIAGVIMVTAVYAHLVADWADEPVIILPVAVLVCLAQVLWGGAGAFSADLAAGE